MERECEYLARCGPFAGSVRPTAGCTRYMTLRIAWNNQRKCALNAFVNAMVAKCEGRERMLVVFPLECREGARQSSGRADAAHATQTQAEDCLHLGNQRVAGSESRDSYETSRSPSYIVDIGASR